MKNARRRYRVAVIDDSSAFRLAAAKFLHNTEGVAFAGSAAGGEAGLTLIARDRPDVVLVDVQMPRMNGFEVAARLNAIPGAPPVILISMNVGDEVRAEARRLGVRAVLQKDELVGGLTAALDLAFRTQEAGAGTDESRDGAGKT